jgi:sporulation protein YlmC with PRC-barrel domain|tara:strand:+ start:26363 stop:27094 length:732 start_codon:yes stop_codon:yes gene_type:complete
MKKTKSTGPGLLSLVVYGLIGYAGYQAYTHFKGGSTDGGSAISTQAPTAGSQVMHSIDKRYDAKIASIPDDGLSRSLDDFIGIDVFGEDESYLGRIDKVYVDTRSGQINFISIVQEKSSFREADDTHYIYPISSFSQIDAAQAAILKKDAQIETAEEQYIKSLELSQIMGADVLNENDQRIGAVQSVAIDHEFNIGHYVVQTTVIDPVSGTNILLLPFQHAMITPLTVGLGLKIQANQNDESL